MFRAKSVEQHSAAPVTDVLSVAAIVALYCILIIPTLPSFGILWDEQNDIEVARSYVTSQAGWLAGSTDDPTQGRLPMYTVALAFALLGRTDLYTARLTSCFVSMLTIVAIYLYARRWLGRPQAQIAATLLATSPLFLAFSRVALTEGDAFITAATAWSIVTLAWAIERPAIGRTAASGAVLGLALSSKFVGIALFPAVVIAPWLPKIGGIERRYDAGARTCVMFAACTLAAQLSLLGWFYWYRPRMPSQAVLAGAVWAAGAIQYASMVLLLARRRHLLVGRIGQAVMALFIAGATFVLIPPVHLTSPELLGSLRREMVRSAGIEPVMIVQSAVLHLLTLLFKPSVAVGLIVFIGPIVTAYRWRLEWRVSLPLACVTAYFAFLVKMRVAQTFYTMPIFPWLLVLAADALVVLWRRRQAAAVGVLAACAVAVAIDLRLTYPHYELNGYQWLGSRYVLGLSTLSYRSVVQVNSDGTEQALVWLNEHVPSHATVKTFIRPDHIIRAVCPAPRFTLIDGLRPPSPSVGDEDYVVTTLLAELRRNHPAGLRGGGPIFDNPYDRATLGRRYEPVFEVKRPFGLVFATVWRRRVSPPDSGNRSRGPSAGP